MALPETNKMNGGLKFLYLMVEEYERDFSLLRQNFFIKFNTNNEKLFIEEEIRRYEKFILIITPNVKHRDSAWVGHLRNLIMECFNGLDNDFKISKGWPVDFLEFEKSLGVPTMLDETFVIISFKKIITFLKNNKDGINKTKSIKPLDFDLNQSEVIYIFDILIEANLLQIPKAHLGGYYEKLETYFTAKGKPIKDAKQKRNKYISESLTGRPRTSEEIKLKLLTALDKM